MELLCTDGDELLLFGSDSLTRKKKLDMVSLCVPGCAGTPSLDQTGHNLRDLSTSASSVLGL